MNSSQKKSHEDSLKFLEIQAVIAQRKRLNPLEFFKPLPGQLRFLSEDASTQLICGGNRSSKTTGVAKKIIDKCISSKLRIWACAETFSDSVNIQQRKIWELLPKKETRYCYYDDVNGFRNRKLIFKTGSIINFKSYDQGRESFQGDDCDVIWFDEEPPLDIYKECRMRLIDRNGKLIISMTSLKGMTELVQEIYEDADIIESQYAPLVGETLPRTLRKGNVHIYTLWSTENNYINQDRLLEETKLMTKQEIKSRIYGIPTSLSGRIYPMFNRNIHVIPPNRIPKSKVTLYHVLDPHDRKPWAMQWWAVDRTGTAYCVREYPWRRNFNEMDSDDKTYSDYADVISATEKALVMLYGRSVSRRIIDPNFGNKTVQLSYRVGNQAATTPKYELKKLGFIFQDGIDSLETGHLAVRKWLHWAEKDGQIIVQPKALINEECENTIRHLSRYSHKDIETSTGDIRDKPGVEDKYKDFADDARYFLMSNPRYIDRFSPETEPTGKVY